MQSPDCSGCQERISCPESAASVVRHHPPERGGRPDVFRLRFFKPLGRRDVTYFRAIQYHWQPPPTARIRLDMVLSGRPTPAFAEDAEQILYDALRRVRATAVGVDQVGRRTDDDGCWPVGGSHCVRCPDLHDQRHLAVTALKAREERLVKIL